MASNFTFGLVAIPEVSEILVLLAQTIVLFSLFPLIFGLVRSVTSPNNCTIFSIYPIIVGLVRRHFESEVRISYAQPDSSNYTSY